jgi:HSP20 family protein
MSALPHWRSLDDLFHDGQGHKMMAVEEFMQDGTMHVRAEIPGIDPDKDVEVTVENGALEIKAERTEKQETTERHMYRSELRYGSFARTIPLPDGVDDSKIEATYKDGILEVTVPMPAEVEQPEHPAHKVPVAHG